MSRATKDSQELGQIFRRTWRMAFITITSISLPLLTMAQFTASEMHTVCLLLWPFYLPPYWSGLARTTHHRLDRCLPTGLSYHSTAQGVTNAMAEHWLPEVCTKIRKTMIKSLTTSTTLTYWLFECPEHLIGISVSFKTKAVGRGIGRTVELIGHKFPSLVFEYTARVTLHHVQLQE